MKPLSIFSLIIALGWQSQLFAQKTIECDTILTSGGPLMIYFVGHGSLFFSFNNTIVHIDPVSRYADYSKFPKADLILITHHHGDHFDNGAIQAVTKPSARLIYTQICSNTTEVNGNILNNGDSTTEYGINIEAVPAYNLLHKRENGEPYHPKGHGNGYVLTFSDIRVYIAGDTENIPEMAKLSDIDIAFLPMNLPYTMTPEMVTYAVQMFRPRILYPYHYGNTNTNELLSLMNGLTYCEVRIRQMQ
ncbi:MAG: MBL fold metallo-hydrolase [Bacteroidales bacterium]|nr:MBL fold metallo-hydrolase [Bacteroidales bacterium]